MSGILGTSGADTITPAFVSAGVTGGAPGNGADSISGGHGADSLDGGGGNDTLRSGNGNATLVGGLGNDLLLKTGSGAARLDGGEGDDSLSGGTGDDVLAGGAGADTLRGGAGIDWASYAEASTGVVASLASPAGNANDAAGDIYDGIENLRGSIHKDALTGDAQANLIEGLTGNDEIAGGDGADTLRGGDGNDILSGGRDDNLLSGGAGDDLLRLDGRRADGQPAMETVDGGSGFDSLDLSAVPASLGVLAVDLAAGLVQVAGGPTWLTIATIVADSVTGFSSVEVVAGASGDDRLHGDDGANTLQGLGGNDQISGRGGNDRLEGGDGFDALAGGAGADTLVGGAQNDWADYSGSPTALRVSLATPALNTGEAAGDVYIGIEHITGSAFADMLSGDAQANLLSGGAGADTLVGGDGYDTMYGRADDDLIIIDSLYTTGGLVAFIDGGAGIDTLAIGGLGPDTHLLGRIFALDLNFTGLNFNLLYLGTEGAAGNISVANVWYGSVEHLRGSVGRDVFVGDNKANRLEGRGGTDSLAGGGSDDTLIGGLDADTLVGGAGIDVVSYETAAEGLRVSLADPAQRSGEAAGDVYAQIEALRGSLHADHLSGDAAANRIEGLDGADTLDAAAGDTLDGGRGADVYRILSSDTLLVDSGDDGARDLVITDISWVTPTIGVEDLLLIGAATIGLGNSLANLITGNALANILSGAEGADTLDGGTGADVLVGGAGRDVFIVDHRRDVIVDEEDAPGVVIASVRWTLGEDLAELRLTGAETLSGTGNARDNLIRGNDAANRLLGLDGADTLDGGLGADLLTGGAGADLFLLGAPGEGDRIGDFAAGDRIGLSLAALGGGAGLLAGQLSTQPTRFAQNLTGLAPTADVRLTYETDAGRLWWDADGSGAAARVLLVQLGGLPPLDAANIWIV